MRKQKYEKKSKKANHKSKNSKKITNERRGDRGNL